MATLNTIVIDPPLLNTSCAWASELHELKALYETPFTGAVTTRTACPGGFQQDDLHTVLLLHSSVQVFC
jgi:dihydroorotate dehydrogenase (fumarate)